MRTLPVIRHKLPHAILLALAAQPEPTPVAQLREKGHKVGRPHAVTVAIERLAQQGLIDIEVRITEEGRKWLRRSGE